jgi:hypothetical protein
MARRLLTRWLPPLLLSVGAALVPTVRAADRHALPPRSHAPSVQLSPDTTAPRPRLHGLPAWLRHISACIEAPARAVTVTDDVSRAITLGLRN